MEERKYSFCFNCCSQYEVSCCQSIHEPYLNTKEAFDKIHELFQRVVTFIWYESNTERTTPIKKDKAMKSYIDVLTSTAIYQYEQLKIQRQKCAIKNGELLNSNQVPISINHLDQNRNIKNLIWINKFIEENPNPLLENEIKEQYKGNQISVQIPIPIPNEQENQDRDEQLDPSSCFLIMFSPFYSNLYALVKSLESLYSTDNNAYICCIIKIHQEFKQQQYEKQNQMRMKDFQ